MQFSQNYQVIQMRHNGTEPKNFHLTRDLGINDYLFIQFKSVGAISIDGEQHPVTPGTFIIITPHTPHELKATNEFFIHDWIHFLPIDEEVFLKQNLVFNKPVKLSYPEKTSSLIQALYIEYVYNEIDANIAIQSYMSLLFINIKRELNTKNDIVANKKVLQKFHDLRTEIYNGKNLNLTVEKAATMLFFSSSRFGVLWKSFFNVSFNADLQEARIFHAKYLLKSTNETISSIAFKCGYQNEFHFIRQFKKHVLTTPNKWRNIEQSLSL